MADEPLAPGGDVIVDEEEHEPLVPAASGCAKGEVDLSFDEWGNPTEADEPLAAVSRPCSLRALNGSWLIQLVPQVPFIFPFRLIRGPMRIEASAERMRVSGDIYVRQIGNAPPFATELENPLQTATRIARRWYPSYPHSEYRWYLGSEGVNYVDGELSFPFERRLWDVANEEFTGADTGRMRLTCRQGRVKPPWAPQPTLRMTGTAVVGGVPHTVTATKTSPYHRGCRVEVDVMANRQWPASALACGGQQTFTFVSVYRGAGMDFVATVNELDVPADPVLTVPEMHNLLAAHRAAAPVGDETWRVWLLVGSRDGGGHFGLMFDDIAPHREGAVGFFDETLPDEPRIEAGARGQPLGDVPLAFLRTMTHEAGHAFNLFHPKADIHKPPIGTTIMNQTGDVIGFASPANPYPCTATMGFDDHNGTSLTHSPDPQVRPGWKEFGWGHSELFAGVAEPTDAGGLLAADEDPPGLRLDLTIPEQVQRGEFVLATVTVTNTGDEARSVNASLNLAEGDLWISMVTPAGARVNVRDVVHACGPSRRVELAPGEELSGQVQLLYTSAGVTFDQPGTYAVRAEFDAGEVPGETVRSQTAQVVVRPAVDDEALELERATTDADVGLAFALGDDGAAPEAREKLTAVMETFPETDTGAACAMVIANSAARPLRDLKAAKVERKRDNALADRALEAALSGRSAADAARLAAAVVSPAEPEAPVVEQVRERISGKSDYKKDDVAKATKILADHLT